ncbi:uncharacterized protein LOC122014760 [Zingiber officinale]|nr:uncharacterized protein LOC122008250 [Zingiber officinale]XP_042427108.1 uncharacterized protein LOC122014760 [Zingiber officinale]KAG6485791.1 hypothetical protein ZIOFF_054356 [Zingiber officinale]
MTATSPPASVTNASPTTICLHSLSLLLAMEGAVKGHLQVPAFGCWNHHYCDDLPIGQYFDSSEFFRGRFNVSVAGRARRGELHREVTMKHQQSGAGKAVDEDLYKVPPEILHQKPKKRLLRNLWGCMRVSSIDMD